MANLTKLAASLTGKWRTFCAGAARAASTTSTCIGILIGRFGSSVRLRFLSFTTCTSSRKEMPSQETQPDRFSLSDDQLALHRHRYREARRAGLTMRDAKLFASSSLDIGKMRSLAENGCPPHLILLIL